MEKPAAWNNDPECGHAVASAYQTHYCTYIRVPRLLTLQQPQSPDELILIVALQWYELWFKVLLADLHAALNEDGSTFEPVKLLRRGVALYKLFALHADLCESIIVRELALKKSLRDANARGVSQQFAQIAALSAQLARRWQKPSAELADAVRDYRAHLDAFRARYAKFLSATLKPSPPAPLSRRKERRQARGNLPSYVEWLRLDELLALQDGIKSALREEGKESQGFWAPEQIGADENMFIVVHQCFEVWFRVLLDCIERAIPLLQRGEIRAATRGVRRVVQIQRLLVQQIQIPATMLPLDFMRFREQRVERGNQVFVTGLSPASGTESYQFREIEIVSGLRDDAVFQKYLQGKDILPIRLLTPRQTERLKQTTLPEAFRAAVQARGVEKLDALFTPANVANPNADLAELADTLLEYDEFFRYWRIAHVTMVEKMIGGKSGTGFLGPEYLMETAGIKIQEKNRVFEERQVRPRFFEDLWRVRTRLGTY
ncbi:MAG: hypothetical protein HY327_00515 [Chloroflexi bacterium]|nr:hypothetical protein [Chloroflexota bacterium]